MLFAQLHNLASHLGFNCVSESMDGSPTGFEEEEQDDWLPPGKEDEADWAASTEEPVPKESVSESTHNDFVGLIKASARGVTDIGAQQPVVGASAAQRWCDRLRKRHGLVPVDVTPHNMTSDLWQNWFSQGRTGPGFPYWNRGSERSDAVPGARGTRVD